MKHKTLTFGFSFPDVAVLDGARARARETGVSVSAYVNALIRADLNLPNARANLYSISGYVTKTRTKKERTNMASSKPKPVCETVFPWLRENIGTRCLAGLTGTDYRALRAAVQIVELWANGGDDRDCYKAFGLVVGHMQESMRWAAYYCIAHVANWRDCWKIWILAGLPPLKNLPRCKWDMNGEAYVKYTDAQAAEIRREFGFEDGTADEAQNTGETPVPPDQHGLEAHATLPHGQDAHATQSHGQDARATAEGAAA